MAYDKWYLRKNLSDHPDFVVVGAGAAGISAAHTLTGLGFSVTVVELRAGLEAAPGLTRRLSESPMTSELIGCITILTISTMNTEKEWLRHLSGPLEFHLFNQAETGKRIRNNSG